MCLCQQLHPRVKYLEHESHHKQFRNLFCNICKQSHVILMDETSYLRAQVGFKTAFVWNFRQHLENPICLFVLWSKKTFVKMLNGRYTKEFTHTIIMSKISYKSQFLNRFCRNAFVMLYASSVRDCIHDSLDYWAWRFIITIGYYKEGTLHFALILKNYKRYVVWLVHQSIDKVPDMSFIFFQQISTKFMPP